MQSTTVKAPISSGHAAVTTTRQPVSSNSTFVIRGVLLKASEGNSGPIYIGGANVTADTATTSGGMTLAAGNSLFLELEDLRALFAVAASGTHDLAWLSM